MSFAFAILTLMWALLNIAVRTAKKSKRTRLEIDFVTSKGSKKYYVQSALMVFEKKREQEIRSLNRVGDSLKNNCGKGCRDFVARR